MALRRSTLNMLSFIYFILMGAVWLGWQYETDHRMQRDRESVAQQLRSTGLSEWQVYNITLGMTQAYDNAVSYASMAVIVVVMCTQGMTSILIASLFDEKTSSTRTA